MKKFNFGLEKLLMIREYIEMEAKLKYASELQKKILIENNNRSMQKSILESISNSYLTAKQGDLLDSNQILSQEAYINGLLSLMKNNENEKKDIDTKLLKLRENLTIAKKDKKVIDELKNKQYRRYKEEMKKEETKNIDEIAGQFVRRKGIENA